MINQSFSFKELVKKAQEAQKNQAKPTADPEAVEKFRARIQEMINKVREAKGE